MPNRKCPVVEGTPELGETLAIESVAGQVRFSPVPCERLTPANSLVAVALFQRGELRLDIRKGAMELIRVALVLARLQIALHTRPRKQQHFPAPPSFDLRRSQLWFCFPWGFRFRILNLSFYGFAFPPFRHIKILRQAEPFRTKFLPEFSPCDTTIKAT